MTVNDPRGTWLDVLRDECRHSSYSKVAAKLGVSATTVCQTVNEKYPGNLKRIQLLVEGAYMGRNVMCPVIGKIPKDECIHHQQRPFSATNPQRVQLYRACRSGCKHSEPGLTG